MKTKHEQISSGAAIATLMTTLVLMCSCVHSTKHLAIIQPLKPPMFEIGQLQNGQLNGLWAGSLRAADGVGEPYDTLWTLVMKDIKFIASSDSIIIAQDAKGTYLLMATTESGKIINQRTKSYSKFNKLKKQRAIPTDLVLQEIKP